jgi:hypothetical protein
MIAVLCALALAIAAAKVAAGEAAMRLHNVVAGWLAALLVLLVAVAVVRWFLFPGRQLPRNRVRVLRVRTRLGLRPGPGWATAFELWLRWADGPSSAPPGAPGRHCRLPGGGHGPLSIRWGWAGRTAGTSSGRPASIRSL